ENERTHFYQPRVDVPAVEDDRPRARPSAATRSPVMQLDNDDYESTRALMPPPQGSSREVDWSGAGPPVQLRDSDRTKIVPLPAARPVVAAPAPAPPSAPPNVPVPTAMSRPTPELAPIPAVVVAPQVAPKAVAPDSPTPQSQQRTDAPTKGGVLAKLKSDWAELSIPKKLILFLMPVAFVMLMLASDDEAPQARGKGKPVASASASVAAKGDDDAPRSKKHGKHRAKSDDDDDDDAPAPAKRADAGVADAASAHVDGGDPPNPATPLDGADAGPKSAERAAVDAVISGDLKSALKLYKQLAKDNPDDDSYAETVRVLKSKIAASDGKKRKARDD
ncbi:MAG: hypothetical protein ACHREM_30340, partial [Polyangiales bacterium]